MGYTDEISYLETIREDRLNPVDVILDYTLLMTDRILIQQSFSHLLNKLPTLLILGPLNFIQYYISIHHFNVFYLT